MFLAYLKDLLFTYEVPHSFCIQLADCMHTAQNKQRKMQQYMHTGQSKQCKMQQCMHAGQSKQRKTQQNHLAEPLPLPACCCCWRSFAPSWRTQLCCMSWKLLLPPFQGRAVALAATSPRPLLLGKLPGMPQTNKLARWLLTE